MINLDELPIPVLALLALGAWLLYGCVIANDVKWNRPDDLHARVAGDDMLPKGVQHGESDHPVEDDESDSGPDEVAEPSQDDDVLRGAHARSVAPGPVALPPGVPSIIERLDRWTELS